MPITALASQGGAPVRTTPWPSWPYADERTQALVRDALTSERWAISEMQQDADPYERRFARAYAEFHGVAGCAPTTSGSSALTIAFESLGLTRGAEVLVPGLTWVACASAVANAGLVPVLVDIDQTSLCMSPAAAEAAITAATEAVLLVHLSCNIADLDAFTDLCRRHGLAMVEDCAQAHGAQYRDRMVGTFGQIGAFSMQESKVLTAGEGGAAITDDPQLYRLMEQYRADGRRYAAGHRAPGLPELDEVGEVQGRNLCLSEVQAAILLGGLERLPSENARRAKNAQHLDKLVGEIPGLTPLPPQDGVTRRTYYQYAIRVDRAEFGGVDVETLRQDLVAELGVFCAPLHDPLNASLLYNPLASPHKYDATVLSRLDPRRFDLPESHRARQEFLTVPHNVLLGDGGDVEQVAEALEKIHTVRGG
ncbi:DegT/DnrJ/EryC1/StrS family aminotransferase [Actinoplanes sp. NPDC051470]|uniref:DegT/DnrJ/EryC1/StrS family aminotransferase n=1 Tax=Actinoplanes sp. NPDC051470 TaxID=3157224 RepID=UPI0034138D80